jgi:DHA2 family multidrug resistance protein-like MFS transporter
LTECSSERLLVDECPGERRAALIEADKTAFTQTHAVLPTAAAVMIAALAVVVFFALAGYRRLS